MAPEPDPYAKYWGNETRLLVMNRTHVWHNDPDPVWRAYNQYTQLMASPCNFQGQIYFNNREVTFDNASRAVWPGTTRIETTLTWSRDAYDQDQLVLATGSGRRYEEHAGYKNGVAKTLEVDPKHWDDESPTAWEFFVCLHEGQGDMGHMFKGSFHIRMTLLRDLNETQARNP